MLSRKLLSASQTASGPAGPIEFVDTRGRSGTTGLSIGINFLDDLQSGDLLMLFLSDDVTQTLSNLSSGWTQMYFNSGFSGTSTVAGFYKTITNANSSFSIDGSTSGAISSAMIAFRNAAFDAASITFNSSNPPSILTSSGDAVVTVLHYQDDNTKKTPTDADLPTIGANNFKYVTSNLSSGTTVWYNLSPTTPTYDIGDITENAPVGDLAVASVRLSNV
jgi:hypothetical protein